MADFTIRPAISSDGAFLGDMVVEAANWRAGATRPKPTVFADPIYRGYLVRLAATRGCRVRRRRRRGQADRRRLVPALRGRHAGARIRRGRGPRADHRRASALACAGRRPLAHAGAHGCRARGGIRAHHAERGARQLRAHPLPIRGLRGRRAPAPDATPWCACSAERAAAPPRGIRRLAQPSPRGSPIADTRRVLSASVARRP